MRSAMSTDQWDVSGTAKERAQRCGQRCPRTSGMSMALATSERSDAVSDVYGPVGRLWHCQGASAAMRSAMSTDQWGVSGTAKERAQRCGQRCLRTSGTSLALPRSERSDAVSDVHGPV